MKIGIYPGSFDPVTNGHLDIIHRAAKVVDVLIVGVLNNTMKNSTFTTEERVTLLNTLTADLKNVQVEAFGGLLVDFVKAKNAKVIVRGLRAVSDFEYELQMAQANHSMAEDVDTIFLVTRTEYSFLSSSIVKDVARHHGDVSKMVPEIVVNELKQKFK